MDILVLDTYRIYKEMFLLSEEQREDFFNKSIVEPFDVLFKLTSMPRKPEMLSCLPLSGQESITFLMFECLKENDIWEKAKTSIEISIHSFEKKGIKLFDNLIVAILPGDKQLLSLSEGYTGIGSIPGYIMLVIAPDENNVKKFPACVAHEFHHNVLFNNFIWDYSSISLSQYLAIEGLAESFSEDLYGNETVGPWVSSTTGEMLEHAKKIIGNNLNIKGFMNVNRYMYGKHPMFAGSESVDLPYCAGYAVGYHAVQKYVKDRKTDVIQATIDFINKIDIVKESGYFE